MKKPIALFISFVLCAFICGIPSAVGDDVSVDEPSAVDIEVILPTLIKNPSGLYPHEILAIEYANKYYFDENKFEGFWWYEYGIKDMALLLESLREHGFLSLSSLSDSLQLYKTDELKAVLKAKGLKVSGKKQGLINRLIESVPENELNECFPRRSYIVTDQGKEAIKDDEYVLFAHKHHYEGIDIYSLNRMLDGHTATYRDCIWEHLNKLCTEYMSQSNYGLYRNIRFQMAEFLLEESNYQAALTLFIEVAFWDTSGLGNGELNIEIAGPSWFPYENTIANTVPGVVKNIIDCKNMLELDDKDFKTLVEDVLEPLNTPFHIFTKNEVADIIELEIEQNTIQLSKVYDTAKKRLMQEYPYVSFE